MYFLWLFLSRAAMMLPHINLSSYTAVLDILVTMLFSGNPLADLIIAGFQSQNNLPQVIREGSSIGIVRL